MYCHGQVLLRLPKHPGNGATPEKGQALVYATSWWNEDTVNEYLQDRRLPIWASLSAARTELYRDVQALYHGTSPFLDRQAHPRRAPEPSCAERRGGSLANSSQGATAALCPEQNVCSGRSCVAPALYRERMTGKWAPGCPAQSAS